MCKLLVKAPVARKGAEKIVPAPQPARAPVYVSKEDRVEPIKGMRKAMVKSMQVAQGIPHFGYCDEIDMTRLVALRKTLKKVAEKKGIKFSYMPVIIKVRLLCLLTSVFTF